MGIRHMVVLIDEVIGRVARTEVLPPAAQHRVELGNHASHILVTAPARGLLPYVKPAPEGCTHSAEGEPGRAALRTSVPDPSRVRQRQTALSLTPSRVQNSLTVAPDAAKRRITAPSSSRQACVARVHSSPCSSPRVEASDCANPIGNGE